MSAGAGLLVYMAMLRIYVCVRQLRFLSASGNKFAYATALVRLRMAHGTTQALFGLAVLGWLDQAALADRIEAIAALSGVMVLQALVDLFARALKSFVVDQGFGFNRLTAGRFLADAGHALALRCGLGAALAVLALASMYVAGAWWWLPFTGVAAICAHFGGDLYQGSIEPRLNRQAGLESGPLALRLEGCLRRCGFSDVGLAVACGSMRSSHANARAVHAGTQRRVVMLDTLLKHLSPEQIEAVLAHELGHFAGQHPRRRFLLLCAIWLVAMYAAAQLAAYDLGAQVWKQLAAVVILAEPIRFLLQPVLTSYLRGCEYQADAFAIRHVPRQALRDALARLYGVNASAPGSDPLFAAFHESHPPMGERLRRLS